MDLVKKTQPCLASSIISVNWLQYSAVNTIKRIGDRIGVQYCQAAAIRNLFMLPVYQKPSTRAIGGDLPQLCSVFRGAIEYPANAIRNATSVAVERREHDV